MKQELENKRPDSEERRSIWQRWKQNLKDWVWFCKEHPDWLDLDVQTWVSTHIGQPLRRRWQRLRELRHQNRQRQLPETEWKLGQLLLFLWGSLPRMGSDLRERLTRRRKGAIRSGGRMRAFFEDMKLHPAVFVAGAVAVTAVAVCLSMYTIGATARYDGVELGTVRSAHSVSAAVDQLEEITRQTLSDTDYSIDSAKLEAIETILSVAELKAMGYTHILYAVGAWKPGQLGIPGDVAGAIQWMKGVKAGNISVGGNVAVVGAGNTAMDAARLAKRSGAQHVTIVYRRTRKYMPADEHELALALADGVTFAELCAPVEQKDGVLRCEKMKLGEADASGRRSPVATGEYVDIPCDLVISAVGEQVDSALLTSNGVEVDGKGRPAFRTNVEGVYAAGDARRGPATVVEGIADAAQFAEAVIGAPHTYDIPQQAYITKADAIAKKGILRMSGCTACEGERCLQCSTVCENCADSCPNRANVVIAMADGSHQILHVDKMCNECGNCTQFCPYHSEPCHDKFTLFQTAEDMADSHNAGVLFLGGDRVKVRTFGEPKEYDLSGSNDLPAELEKLIVTVRDRYAYLFA